MHHEIHQRLFDWKVVLLEWILRFGISVGYYFIVLEAQGNLGSLMAPTIIAIAILVVSSWHRELILTSTGIISRKRFFSFFSKDDFIHFNEIDSIESNKEEKRRVSYYLIFASHSHSNLLKKNRIRMEMKNGNRKDFYIQRPMNKLDLFVEMANKMI